MGAKILNSEDIKTKVYLAKIGEIVVLLNHLEQALEFFSWELINARDNSQGIGRRITTPLLFMEKLDLLRSLIVERFGQDKAQKFLPIYSEIKRCGEIRNDIAHSLWFIEYGNLDENLQSETKKINYVKALARGKDFDFSKATENVDLKKLNSYSEKISEVITLIYISVFELLNVNTDP